MGAVAIGAAGQQAIVIAGETGLAARFGDFVRGGSIEETQT
jgi:hypothetical protein